MDSSLYVVGSRMNGLSSQLQVIASNVSNADSAGFKRMVCTFASQDQATTAEQGAMSPVWPELSGMALDTTQGAIRQTGRPLDLAIEGSAFFAVNTPDGTRYTRKGRIYESPSGELTDAAGNPFSAGGGSLRVPAGVSQLTVLSDGEVIGDQQAIGKLSLMDVPSQGSLVPLGSGYYRNDGAAAKPSLTSEVQQGALEDSNVEPVTEMVNLIEVTRAYEAGARILHRMDTLGDQLVKSAS